MSKEHDVNAIACEFQIDGEFAAATAHGSGHINDSYCVTFHQAGMPARYILQRINHTSLPTRRVSIFTVQILM